MQNTTETIRHKIVIINRAVSGSGKTSMTRYVIENLRAHGLSVAVCSTDDFFMVDGRYVFEVEKLNGYHAQNLANFTEELERGTDVVICDNMNLLPWQSQPYTDAARKGRIFDKAVHLKSVLDEIEGHVRSKLLQNTNRHGIYRAGHRIVYGSESAVSFGKVFRVSDGILLFLVLLVIVEPYRNVVVNAAVGY